jgi:hypothetical protein
MDNKEQRICRKRSIGDVFLATVMALEKFQNYTTDTTDTTDTAATEVYNGE